MRFRKLYYCLVFLSVFFDLKAQECGFETPENYQTYEEAFTSRTSNMTTTPICLNICFRILRDDDGTNTAMSPSIIPQILDQLNTYYNPHNIYFKQVGTYDYINNSRYNNRQAGAIEPVNIPNCINLYFIKSFGVNANGQPSGIVGIADSQNVRARIKGSYPMYGITAHEVGHILNLLHTFNCTVNPEQACTESPYTSTGCATKGDLICDTPADYNSTISTANLNLPFPLSSYNPDKNNIMSYWPNKNRFTAGQGLRMRSAIFEADYLQSIRSYDCAKIEGKTVLCPGQTAPYYVSGVAFGSPTYNWSVSNNLQIIGSANSFTVNVKKIGLTGGSTITATINGNIVRTKRVRCLFFYRLIGLYDWVSKDYGNMGLIVPIDNEEYDDPVVLYNWEIKENPNSTITNNSQGKPYFVGTTSNQPHKFTSNSNQAIVNWGSDTNSYLITCNGITASGEEFPISVNYVDVGDPKNNPCFKDAVQSIISPNPVRNGQINIIVNKPENITPCNYKDLEEPQFFNSKLDKVNNSITIFDFTGNIVYSNIFESNEFIIENLNLISGDNYVVNLYTNEGGFRQQVIIAE